MTKATTVALILRRHATIWARELSRKAGVSEDHASEFLPVRDAVADAQADLADLVCALITTIALSGRYR